jgi:hypothetical protein
LFFYGWGREALAGKKYPAFIVAAMVALLGCRAKAPGGGETTTFARGKIEKGIPLVLELSRSGAAAFTRADAPASLSPAAEKAPWTAARAPRGFVRAGGSLLGALNACGAVVISSEGSGELSFDFIEGIESFKGRTVSSVWVRDGRAFVFLAANDAFGPAAAAPLLLSFAPGETAFRAEEFPFAAAYPPPWKAVSADPSGTSSLRMQLVKEPLAGESEAEEAYVEIGPNGAWKEISSREYLSAWIPLPAEKIPAEAASLPDPALVLARYARGKDDAFVAFSLRAGPSFAPRCYGLSGQPDALFTADAWGWMDETLALASHPDGSLRYRARSGAAGSPTLAALPALPANFDYGECAAVGDIIVVSWAESVYPDIGRAGICALRR